MAERFTLTARSVALMQVSREVAPPVGTSRSQDTIKKKLQRTRSLGYIESNGVHLTLG